MLLTPCLLWIALQNGVPMEWTLEEARDRWSPMVRPVQHVGMPGYPFQVGVMWDGALVFGPLEFLGLGVMQREIEPMGNCRMHVSVGFGEPMRLLDRKGTGNSQLRRGLHEGRYPIPWVESRDGDLVYREEVFAHLLGRAPVRHETAKPDDVLVAQVHFAATNSGSTDAVARLWLHFGDTSSVRLGYKASQSVALAPALPIRNDPPFGLLGEKVRFVLPQPAVGKVEERGAGLLRWEVPLRPGETADLRLAIPYGLLDEAAAQRLLKEDPQRRREEVVRYWKQIQSLAGEIRTPDPFVNDYLSAVVGHMAQQVAFRLGSDVWMYKTSPNHYEGYWPSNAAKALPTFDYRGLGELNRKVLQGFLDHQTADVGGLDRAHMGQGEALAGEGYEAIHGFMGNFGEWTANPLLLSHGLGMWALAQHYRITRDDKWLKGGPRPPLQAMVDAFDWVAKQRRRTMREVDGERVPYWGLLPAASAHDWLAGNTIFNDAFCIYGTAEVVRVLREIAHPRAEEMRAELADYRKCLRERYAEASAHARRVPLPDGTSIPYVPRMVQELDWAKIDWTYTGYGPLRAGAWGALDPHDPLVTWALTFLEAGMPKGDGPYFNAPSQNPDTADRNFADISDPAADRHFLLRHWVEYETMWPIGAPLFLARDDLPRFFEWLFHNLAVAVHRDWRVGVESLDGVPSCAPGDSERWQAIRAMFVNEREGYDGGEQSLWLLQAIPRCWLRPGMTLGVMRMGTTFGGQVQLSAETAADGDSLSVRVSLRGLRVKPKEVVLRLRSGDGRPLRSAELDGKPLPVRADDTVLLPTTLSGEFEVIGRF